jgi:hypothetical protein
MVQRYHKKEKGQSNFAKKKTKPACTATIGSDGKKDIVRTATLPHPALPAASAAGSTMVGTTGGKTTQQHISPLGGGAQAACWHDVWPTLTQRHDDSIALLRIEPQYASS